MGVPPRIAWTTARSTTAWVRRDSARPKRRPARTRGATRWRRDDRRPRGVGPARRSARSEAWRSAGSAVEPGEEGVELRLGRRLVVEKRAERPRLPSEILGELGGIQHAAEPLEADEPVHRR